MILETLGMSGDERFAGSPIVPHEQTIWKNKDIEPDDIMVAGRKEDWFVRIYVDRVAEDEWQNIADTILSLTGIAFKVADGSDLRTTPKESQERVPVLDSDNVSKSAAQFQHRIIGRMMGYRFLISSEQDEAERKPKDDFRTRAKALRSITRIFRN